MTAGRRRDARGRVRPQAAARSPRCSPSAGGESPTEPRDRRPLVADGRRPTTQSAMRAGRRPPRGRAAAAAREGLRRGRQGAAARLTTSAAARSNKKNGAADRRLRAGADAAPDGDEHWPASSAPPERQPQGRREPRVALANWITDTEHGAGNLLARVIVNRLWQHHFGRGIVGTPNDFGAQGDPPTHPELLDYLAGELIRGGWKLKPLHKLIMTSAVYHARRRRQTTPTWRPTRRTSCGGAARRGGSRPRRSATRLLAVSGTLDRDDVRPRHAGRDQPAAERLPHGEAEQAGRRSCSSFDAPEPIAEHRPAAGDDGGDAGADDDELAASSASVR